MRRKEIIMSLLCVLFIPFAGCHSAIPASSQELNFIADVGISEPDYKMPSIPENLNPDTSDAFRINNANIYMLGENLNQYNLSINNLKIEKLKLLPDNVAYQNFLYFDIDKVDGNGKLTGDTSYLFLTFDATNKGDKPLTFTWNSMAVFAVDEAGYVLSEQTLTSWEARYRSGKDWKELEKDYFVQTLNPGETASVTIGFLIDDTYINSEYLYFAPTAGLSGELYNKWKLYQLNTPGDSK